MDEPLTFQGEFLDNDASYELLINKTFDNIYKRIKFMVEDRNKYNVEANIGAIQGKIEILQGLINDYIHLHKNV